MEKNKEYFLCGGVLFFLLKQAALPNGTPRDHKVGVKDEHSDPILMQDLIYTFTGSQHYAQQRIHQNTKTVLAREVTIFPSTILQYVPLMILWSIITMPQP